MRYWAWLVQEWPVLFWIVVYSAILLTFAIKVVGCSCCQAVPVLELTRTGVYDVRNRLMSILVALNMQQYFIPNSRPLKEDSVHPGPVVAWFCEAPASMFIASSIVILFPMCRLVSDNPGIDDLHSHTSVLL